MLVTSEFYFQELNIKRCPVVFASFSGGPKACMYKVLQVSFVILFYYSLLKPLGGGPSTFLSHLPFIPWQIIEGYHEPQQHSSVNFILCCLIFLERYYHVTWEEPIWLALKFSNFFILNSGYRMIINWSGTVLLAIFMIPVQLILPVTWELDLFFIQLWWKHPNHQE